ncbi:MAG: uncharacterized protein QOF33_221 [Thermomicrobiales bacterium]|nr:uncharacterized protein [Thermomicrobiales bacterium]
MVCHDTDECAERWPPEENSTIVDADTHISPTPQGGNSVTIEELLRRMDRAGVDKALTWLQPPYLRDETETGNAYVHWAMRDHPDRIQGISR